MKNNNNNLDIIYFIAYVPFLFLVAKFYKKNCDENELKYLRFHAKQGMIVTLIGLFVFLFDNLNARILLNIIPLPVFIIINYIIAVLWILWLSFIVKAFVNLVKNQHKKLPVISIFLKKENI